ncbi:MAG: hypothetical protein ABIQ39_02975 [Ilumatobacteraceae bacterium]
MVDEFFVFTEVEPAAVGLDRDAQGGDCEVHSGDEFTVVAADHVLRDDRWENWRTQAFLDQLLEPRTAHLAAPASPGKFDKDQLGASLTWPMKRCGALLQPQQVLAAALEVVECAFDGSIINDCGQIDQRSRQ